VVYRPAGDRPADALLFAVKEVLRNLFDPQRAPGMIPAPGAMPATREAMILGPDVLIPSRARVAMEPYVQEFGFA
jgi:hypothetical protein